MRVLIVTSEWPTAEHPEWVPYLVQEIKYLKLNGVKVQVFSFRGSKNPLNYLKAWVNLRRMLKETSYDLMHAHFGQSTLLALPKFLPLVVTYRGSDLLGDVNKDGNYTWQGKLLTLISKTAAHLADEIIVVSSSLGKKLPKGLPFHIIPSGVDLELFRPIEMRLAREKLNLPLNEKLILFGGRPEMPVKRYALAKEAVDLLKQDNVRLLVTNNVPHSQMPLYINASDLVLLTSCHEGSPNIVKEALACNKPVVSTDVGDVRKRIGSIHGCKVCLDDRPESIASALVNVLEKGEHIDGRNAIIDIDETTLVEKIMRVYQQAVTKYSSP